MQLTWLAVAIAATVACRLILKLPPAAANPYLCVVGLWLINRR